MSYWKNARYAAIGVVVCGGIALVNAQTRAVNESGCKLSPEIRHSIEVAISSAEGGRGPARLPETLPCLKFRSSNYSFTVVRTWEDPVLKVIHFRLRCMPSSTCLPFLVTVSEGKDSQNQSLEADKGWEQVTSTAPSSEHRSRAAFQPPRIEPAAVMPGQKVILIWQHGTMRMSRKVVCLDRGARGEQVRARTEGTGRVVRGRVIGPGVLETLS
jgi:hypothetical protein